MRDAHPAAVQPARGGLRPTRHHESADPLAGLPDHLGLAVHALHTLFKFHVRRIVTALGATILLEFAVTPLGY